MRSKHRKRRFSMKPSLKDQPQYNGYTAFTYTRGGANHCLNEKISHLNAMSQYGEFRSAATPSHGFGYTVDKLADQSNLGGQHFPEPVSVVEHGNEPIGGARLPRPYGPRDNAHLTHPHFSSRVQVPRSQELGLPEPQNIVNGRFRLFSKTKTRKRKSRKKAKRKKRRSKTRRRRTFGITTPGTNRWRSMRNANRASPYGTNFDSSSTNLSYAQTYMQPSKLRAQVDPVMLFQPTPYQSMNVPKEMNLNVPLQYSKNQHNSACVKFGKSSRRRRTFGGATPSTHQMIGKNDVAYQKDMNLYMGAGANTTDFVTANKVQQLNAGTYRGNPYRPMYEPIDRVQTSLENPTGYLSLSKGLNRVSGEYPAWTYTHEGSKRILNAFGKKGKKGKNKFGGNGNNNLGLIYSRDNLVEGNTLYQPLPVYMKDKLQKVSGSYAAFGNEKKMSSSSSKGKTITLTNDGKVSVT